jgi:hypothetical protein
MGGLFSLIQSTLGLVDPSPLQRDVPMDEQHEGKKKAEKKQKGFDGGQGFAPGFSQPSNFGRFR